ncbi:MAG: hypothetical protein K2K53_13050 [Oscillospiraceae bacterium]|nr:hypothetical protein [Oscillospiraceae bacterium]
MDKHGVDINEITGTPAGTPLQGAVYEISEARSGKVKPPNWVCPLPNGGNAEVLAGSQMRYDITVANTSKVFHS